MDREPVYVTGALLDALLAFARDEEPAPVNVSLVATPAEEWADLPAETPVFAEFYFPDAGHSVRAVFGIDLGRPPRSTGRFVSHPAGDRDLSVTDDLAARVLVAVPPWERENVAAYDRSGRRRPLRVIPATPPERRLE